jgi:hypothetical protein
MLNDLNRLKKLANSGKVQLGFFPFLRRDIDEAVFTNLISSGVDQEAAYLAHSKLMLKELPRGPDAHYLMVNRNANYLGFSIKEYSSIKAAGRIRSNLQTLNFIGRSVWMIKRMPTSIVNGYVMQSPHNGKLAKDLEEISRSL